ncbi:MAG: hypothetical protein ONB05_01745 [candidate division KSB1 bacterium]|nr:hypothetical protein [candidate division KSB1 bacterium]
MQKLGVALLMLGLLLILVEPQALCQGVESYLKEGDAYFEQYDTQKALAAYLKAYQADSSNYQAIWKLARSYIDTGEKASDEKEQKSLYLKAERLARKAVAVYPDSAEGHFQLSVAVGRVGLLEGGKKKVELSKEVKTEAEKALELDPKHDGAHHVLARWHREVANLNWALKAFAKILYGGLPPASNEKAIEHFKKAIEIKPEHINHHLELGITYKMLDQWDLARAEFQKVLDLPIGDADDPEHKTEAKKLLDEIKGKK